MKWESFAVAVTFGHLLARLVEYRVHRANYLKLVDYGFEERADLQIRIYYALTLIALPISFLEGQIIGYPELSSLTQAAAALALGLSVAIRFWSILTLGPLWSMRCVAHHSVRHKGQGPYRWLNHPEYLTRIIDTLVLTLLLGGQATAVIFTTMICIMSGLLIRSENQQLFDLTLNNIKTSDGGHFN